MAELISKKKKLNISNHRNALFDMYSDFADDFFGETIDKSKSSFMRYLNELTADISADIQLQNSLMFNEAHLNTARFRESILNTASPLGYIEPLAEPESIMSTISIKISSQDMDRPGRLNTIRQEDLVFNDGNIAYMLTGDITFIMNERKVWSVSMHDRDGISGSEQIASQLISVDEADGKTSTYLIFKTLLKQYLKEVTTHIVTKRKSLIFYKFQFDTEVDNLYDVRISRIGPNGRKVYLSRINSVLDETSDFEKEIFTLTSISSNKFEISLDNGSRFKFIPSGTELTIEAYVTKGTEGRVKNPEFTVVNNSDSNRTVLAYGEGYSSGGRDALDNIELKRDIYKTLQTPDRKTIITEQDFINIISDATGQPVDELAYLLRRNDPIQRQSDFFMKFYNHNDELLQTNSLDLYLDDTTPRFFPTFSRFYMEVNAFDKPLLRVADENDETPGRKFFRTPVPMRLSDFPHYHTNAFKVGNNGSVATVETYTSLMDTEYTIFSDFVSYNYDEDTKTTTFSVILKSNKNEIFQTEDYTKDLRVLLEYENGFIELNQCPVETYLFKAMVTTSEEFDEFNQMLCGNINVIHEDGTIEHVVENRVPIKHMFNANLIVMAPGKETVLNNTGDKEVLRIYEVFDTTDITVFSSRLVENIKMFDAINEIYLCNVFENPNDPGLIINGLPVIGEPDYLDPRNKESISNLIVTLGSVYSHIYGIKEEPSTLAIKFANTYGFTDEYSNTTTSNVQLDVEVTLNANLVEVGTADRIKKIISEHVNTRGKFTKVGTSATRHIYLSEIIREVLDIPGVIQVRILNKNDNFYFRGSMDYTMLPKHKIEYFTPTVLNTRSDYINLTIR